MESTKETLKIFKYIDELDCFIVTEEYQQIADYLGLTEWNPVVWIGRLFTLDSWQIVKSLFDARSIDPRVTSYPWLAEELLTQAPDEGYAPTAGGFLDAERVWGIVLKAKYGFPSSRPDLSVIDSTLPP